MNVLFVLFFNAITQSMEPLCQVLDCEQRHVENRGHRSLSISKRGGRAPF